MKLFHLSLRKLFGLLDYDIPLDQNEITMLTGPNGYGKTMILKIINSIISNELNILCRLKFEVIKVEYQGGTVSIYRKSDSELYLEHTDSDLEDIATENLHLEGEDNLGKSIFLNWSLGNDKNNHLSLNEKKLRSTYLGDITSEKDVSFIRADRLQVLKDEVTVIDSCAFKLKCLMEMAQDESAALSQKLDATFPIRLFERLEHQKRFFSNSIEMRLKGVQDKRRLYMCYGLIQAEDELMPEKSTSLNSSNEYLGVLDLYIEDALGKLSPFETLHKKIDLFESIIKEKILAFKSIIIDKDNGFYFKSLNGDLIDRNMLSSGEQNQIVLLFNLIFDLVSQKIILIDEPEISLHVAWQKTFLDSLKKIQKINQYEKVIIATHSPQVISNNWALTFDLFELIKKSSSDSYNPEGDE